MFCYELAQEERSVQTSVAVTDPVGKRFLLSLFFPF